MAPTRIQIRLLRHALLEIAVCLSLIPALTSFAGQDSKLIISTEDETTEDVAKAPCKESERLKGVVSLFNKMGAASEEVIIEKRDGVENVVVRKQGQAQGIIVVGAHYDKTPAGCGAIDNWTGIVAITHIYRSLKDVPLQKTLIFVAFGREEEGLLGSKAMANNIKKGEISQYCAMVNIDSLGMTAPQVAPNLSSKTLTNRVAEIAQRMKMPFSKVTIPQAGADSIPFKERSIPAITISGLGNNWGDILHTRFDQVARVHPGSVYLGYRLALSLINELDSLPCEVSRGEPKAQ
jgi:hypothetical protein